MAFALQWWMYLLAILIGLLGGALLVSVGYFIHAKFQSKWLKKKMENMPKDKKLVSQWLEQPNVKKVMLDGGPITKLDEKEAEEDERERFQKFREFEKLRRINQGTESTVESGETASKLSERSSLSKRYDSSSSGNKERIEFE